MTSPVDDSGARPSRRSILAAGALALAAACGKGRSRGQAASTVPTTTGSSSTTTTTAAPTGPARFIVSGPTTKPRVALTFHTDGDLTLAAQLLDVLASRKTVITSFVVGQWLDANPTWAKRLLDAGHELANHTYTHPTFSSLTPAAMSTEIVRCRDVLIRLTGSGGRYFRPSGTDDGFTSPSAAGLDAAGAAGYPVVLGYDVDPLDYQDPGGTAVAQRTLATVRAGSVVSLHFGHAGTIAALPTILDGLAQRGLTPVTVSQLLGA